MKIQRSHVKINQPDFTNKWNSLKNESCFLLPFELYGKFLRKKILHFRISWRRNSRVYRITDWTDKSASTVWISQTFRNTIWWLFVYFRGVNSYKIVITFRNYHLHIFDNNRSNKEWFIQKLLNFQKILHFSAFDLLSVVVDVNCVLLIVVL